MSEDNELDGMAAYINAINNPNRGDPNWPLPSFDAKDWAEAFCKLHPGMDEGLMLSWFANALMRGYDEHARRGAIATQTDRYAQGFERAREMALQECREYTKDVQSVPGSFTASGCIAASEDLSDAIRNMEMPDETSDNR